MKQRLLWGFLLGGALLAQRPGLVVDPPTGSGRSALSHTMTPRIPAGTQAQGKQFEGFAVTDYFNFEQNYVSPANPEIATGPEDILFIVNRQIGRLPNSNADGVAPSAAVTQKAFLDAWIGEAALNQLCPTQPRTTASCVFDNASVRYDQIHGRYLVLFTVVDTGTTILTQAPTSPRKSSWVLLVSRFGVLTPAGSLAPPVTPPPGGNSDIFVATRPPAGSVTGGVNAALWFLYYGSAVNGPGADGFGNVTSGLSNVGPGNINAVPGRLTTGAAQDAVFDCRPEAIQVNPTRVCYVPTSARLGIDNDAITIVSAVLNANVANPGEPIEIDRNVGRSNHVVTAYAGHRIRVIKKSAIYTAGALTAGNQFAGSSLGDPARFNGAYYDLYSNPNGQGTPITNPLVPYTAVVSAARPDVSPNFNAQSPVFYEPAHLRGRPMATYSNAIAPSESSFANSATYLVGAIASDQPQTTLFVQGIRYIPATCPCTNNSFTFPNGLAGPIPFYPMLQNQNDANSQQGFPGFVGVQPFANPGLVTQQNLRTQAAGTNPVRLYVGDNRPHRVIFREGHLYVARVTGPVGESLFNAQPLSATVAYDVIQKQSPISEPTSVLATKWFNTQAYAPMFDVPANVVQFGQASPINLFPFLEKLFVGTTYPPLVANGINRATDPRFLEAVTGAPITGPGTVDVCASAQLQPAPPPTTNVLAWPSLFDVRCGEDPYDATFQVRDPATGVQVQRTPFGYRGGASTDPNDGSLWVYGAYARKRFATVPTGQWGTYGANYKLDFPAQDPYGNAVSAFDDVARTEAYFPFVQIARQNGVAFPRAGTTNTFGANDIVTRGEMARWIVLSQMNEQAITDYLAATQGQFGPPPPAASSFADVNPTSPLARYIEVMYRRGYTKGCQATIDVVQRYCPNDPVTRGQVAVFVIRAKLNNVFPTVLSGCPNPVPGVPVLDQCSTGGDNFGLFVPTQTYFTDNPAPAPQNANNPAFVFLQKMRELRITNGRNLGPQGNGVNGQYGFDDPLTRWQIAVFLTRAFFL